MSADDTPRTAPNRSNHQDGRTLTATLSSGDRWQQWLAGKWALRLATARAPTAPVSAAAWAQAF